MIRVGFVLIGSKGWVAGLHYRRNLLHAISTLDGGGVEPVLFVGRKTEEETLRMFSPICRVVRSSFFDRNTVSWSLGKVFEKYLGSMFVLNRIMRENGIVALSHSEVFGRNLPYATINWIPDFQPFRLPDMFGEEELRWKRAYFEKVLRQSDRIIVSSNDSLKDAKEFAPEHVDRVRVLRFVSQPDKRAFEDRDPRIVEDKYGFKGKFFYLPNQLWKHKNHMVVFEAVNILEKYGKRVLVLCTGHMNDYRDQSYAENLKKYVVDQGLAENIRFLGLIDYRDVLHLMRFSVAVINPSLFEGWSSTVEEAKSIGKSVIVSDIPVHREQRAPGAVYFDPKNPRDLADILWRRWEESPGGPEFDLEEAAGRELAARTHELGTEYRRILIEALISKGLRSEEGA